MIYNETERTELQLLLDGLGPDELDYLEQLIYLVRTDDRRIHALIGARDAGQLTFQQYYTEAQQLCAAVKSGQRLLH